MLTIRIVDIRGVKVDRDYVLSAEGALILGRDAACDVCLDDPLASRRHARIFNDGGVYYIEDLGSRTGTVVDGESIKGVTQLRDGTRIVVGGTKIIAYLTPRTSIEAPSSYSGEDEGNLEGKGGECLDFSHPSIYRDAVDEACRLRWPDLSDKDLYDTGIPLPPELFEPRRPILPAEWPGGSEAIPFDEVECSVFAPPRSRRGCVLFVQMFAHTPAQTEDAERMARQFDDQSQRRGFSTLDLPVPRGARLTFHLLLPGLETHDPVQHLAWRGRPGSVQFSVTVPADFAPGVVVGTARISLDSAPLGHVKFKLEVTAGKQPHADKAVPAGVVARRYRKAFISYASVDRDEVLKRVQMLRQVGVDFFQDLLDLEPGSRWEEQLYRHIDDSDLFLLFWSSAARQSKWVMEELRYALQRKGSNELATPEIQPVVIEGPPPPPPPEELAHLHFNDYFLYFIGRGK